MQPYQKRIGCPSSIRMELGEQKNGLFVILSYHGPWNTDLYSRIRVCVCIYELSKSGSLFCVFIAISNLSHFLTIPCVFATNFLPIPSRVIPRYFHKNIHFVSEFGVIASIIMSIYRTKFTMLKRGLFSHTLHTLHIISIVTIKIVG